MANWYGTSRSNYFMVKDEVAFRKWADACSLEVLEDAGSFGITPDENSDGYWPTTRDPGGEEDYIEIDIVDELPQFLAEGQVAILMTSGAEKVRYVTGDAVAVAWDGRMTYISINDIYAKAAEEFGVDHETITPAEY